MTIREQLHRLVDELPESRAGAAEKLLRALKAGASIAGANQRVHLWGPANRRRSRFLSPDTRPVHDLGLVQHRSMWDAVRAHLEDLREEGSGYGPPGRSPSRCRQNCYAKPEEDLRRLLDRVTTGPRRGGA